MDPGFYRYWVPDPLIVETGLRILIVSGIPDSLSCILYSTAKICWIPDSTSKSFPDSGIRIPLHGANDSPFPSSPGPLFQNEVKCSAFDIEIIFHSPANKTHLHKKSCAPSLILKVRVFGTRKWPIIHEAFRLSPSNWLKFIAWFVIPCMGLKFHLELRAMTSRNNKQSFLWLLLEKPSWSKSAWIPFLPILSPGVETRNVIGF